MVIEIGGVLKEGADFISTFASLHKHGEDRNIWGHVFAVGFRKSSCILFYVLCTEK